MITKIFDMEESVLYDALTDDQVIEFTQRVEKINENAAYHTNRA